MREEQLSEGFFEARFGQAVIDNFDQALEEIPEDEELKDFELSEFHEARMRRLFAKGGRRDRVKR